jgi:ribonuclease HI
MKHEWTPSHMKQQSLAGFQPTAADQFAIVFDGGSRGNPGRGYGSYKIYGPTGELAHEQLNYDHLGNQVTNNQAEYLTLIGALQRLALLLGERVGSSEVIVRGDSQLVINQLLGTWKVRNVDLQPLHRQAGDLLRRFGRRQLLWHDRANSVRVLGH